MITDTNSVINLLGNTLVGATSGDWTLLGILILLSLSLALIYAKVRTGTALLVGISWTFIFSVLTNDFTFMIYIAAIYVAYVFVNAFRKNQTGYI